MNSQVRNLITIFTLLMFFEAVSQDKCIVICRENTVTKVENLSQGDIYLETCDKFTGRIGGACDVLNVSEFEYEESMIGKKYWLMNLVGQWTHKGIVTENLINELPKNKKILIRVKGYKLKYVYTETVNFKTNINN